MKLPKKIIGLAVLFTFMNLLDIITSFFILQGETNPIYLIFKSHWLFYLIKIGFNLGVLYGIFIKMKEAEKPNKESVFAHFLTVQILILGIILFGIGAYSNMNGILNPELIQEASTISSGIKLMFYAKIVSLIYLLPSAIIISIFYFYDDWIRQKGFYKED